MKALVLVDKNRFEYKEVPTPKVQSNEVLIQVKACGICGSDIHGMDGSTGRRKPPIIMGHEASGEIKEVGNSVKDYQEGDRVTFDSTIYCGSCFYCNLGSHNLCDHRRVVGVSCDDYHRDGAMAEYISLPENILYRIPDGLSYEKTAMVEPVSVAFHAVDNSPLKINDSVVVVGAGIIGLFIIQSLKLVGCGNIIAVDLNELRLSLAAKFGASYCMKPNADAIKKIYEMTDGRGADSAFEVVGLSSTLDFAVKTIRKGGFIKLVGNLSKEVNFPLQAVVTQEKNILSSCASNGEYKACLEMIQRGSIDVEPLISCTPDLKEGEEWFNKLYQGEGDLFKVILKP
jgi:L-iditol 2-dehydrogenase